MKRPKNAKMYGKMQQGGTPVFTSQQQITAANEQAKQFAMTRGLASGEDTYVARNVGDPMPYMRTTPGANTPDNLQGLSSYVPSDVTELQWNSDRNLPYFIDPKSGDIQYTNPANFYSPRFQQHRGQPAMARQLPPSQPIASRQAGGLAQKAYYDRMVQLPQPTPSYNFATGMRPTNTDSALYDISFNAMMNEEPYALRNRAAYEQYGIPITNPNGGGTNEEVYNMDRSRQNAYQDALSQRGRAGAAMIQASKSMKPRRMGGKYGNMQRGGLMYEQMLRDQQIRMQNSMNNTPNFNQPLQESDIIPGVNAPLPEVAQQQPDRLQEGISKGIIQQPNGYDSSQKWYDDMKKMPNDHPAPDTPRNWKQPLGIGIKAVRTLLGEISGRVARSRQNQYDYTQQTALGQMNPMPATDYQPTPYQPYAQVGGFMGDIGDYNLEPVSMKYGGLQHVNYFGPPFSNGANMRFDSGNKYDEVLIRRKIIPEILRLANRKQGGIHIKEENKGKFTNYCGGKVTEECIEKGKDSPSATIRKRATFAANARKWND